MHRLIDELTSGSYLTWIYLNPFNGRFWYNM
jgi:hypothetical protein